jgi:hypothetical protein
MNLEVRHEALFDEVVGSQRCLFYEQLGYAFPDFWPVDALIKSSPRSEAERHRANIRILLLYFDRIFIHYNTVLNHPLLRRQDMMQHLLYSEDFVHLARSGLITFIGEGPTNDEILRFHREYVAEFGSPGSAGFDELLRNSVTVSRSGTAYPDHSLQSSVLSVASEHLQAGSDEFKAVERYVGDGLQVTGGDVALSSVISQPRGVRYIGRGFS